MLSSPGATGAEPGPALRDGAAVHASDQTMEALAAWCERESPAEGGRLRAALAQWREQHQVAAVRERLLALAPKAVVPMSADSVRRLQARMAAQGAPAKVCAQTIALFGSAELNLRERYPAAYGAPASAQRTVPATASGALLLNPAQLAALAARTPYEKGRSTRQRLEVAGLAGTLAIRGLVIRRGESLFLDHQEGAFQSRVRVSPGIDLRAYEGQVVTVAGELDDWPSAVAFLRRARLIDAAGLAASTEPVAAGLWRTPIEAGKVRTAPGRGVATRDVTGVIHHGQGKLDGYGSFQWEEKATVLLGDGWATTRLDVPPADLDVKASRELEPQRWGRWRRAGNGYEVQWQDDHGRPREGWSRLEGRLAAPWPAGSRLRGAYETAAYHGSIGLGGVYSKRTHLFREDGGYEDSRFSQGYSGGMAATAGFNSSTTSVSNKSGSSSVSSSTSSAGLGTPPGTSAPGVTVTSKGSRDDGARHRGSYALDGYTLEIRRDDGRVDRYLSFPSTGNAIWIGERSFSPPKQDRGTR